VAIWGSLPGAIGDFAFQAANGLISGVEAMLNGVVTRINSFIETLNAALALLPEWATGEGGVRIGTLDPVELGRIGNPFEGAATAAGAAAADAFSAALSRTYLEPPDLGLGAMADDARARADGYREAAGMLADAAGRPLASWQALKDAVTGTGTEAEAALADAAASADALTSGLNGTATAADSAGGAARDAGAAAAEGADTALTGWQAVTAALADYAAKARDIGGDVGSALVGAFQSAENAIGDFVKTGKLDFRDLVTSMIADLAKLAARRFILGPIANVLSGALGGAGGIFANILHTGGMVGAPGLGRTVPALGFANAPRMHDGGWAGLRPDEVPTILQRGERVLSRREAAGYGPAGASTVNVTINARDADSFRQSRTQVASDIALRRSSGQVAKAPAGSGSCVRSALPWPAVRRRSECGVGPSGLVSQRADAGADGSGAGNRRSPGQEASQGAMWAARMSAQTRRIPGGTRLSGARSAPAAPLRCRLRPDGRRLSWRGQLRAQKLHIPFGHRRDR
jgi:hypothetical protein